MNNYDNNMRRMDNRYNNPNNNINRNNIIENKQREIYKVPQQYGILQGDNGISKNNNAQPVNKNVPAKKNGNGHNNRTYMCEREVPDIGQRLENMDSASPRQK